MAIGYLMLAIVLAVTLNARMRWLRVAGTIVAALGLSMMILSILLANLDGTFATVPADATAIRQITPAILNIQAVIAAFAVIFLAWSAWTQARRPVAASLPVHNNEGQYGKVSRGFHWMIAVLMFCLVPIGLFMAILPDSSPEKAGFVSAHQSLGLTVLILAIGRIGWLIMSPPPQTIAALGRWERRASRAVHACLYCVLLAFPVTGYLISQGASVDFFGWSIAATDWNGTSKIAESLHGWALPTLFYIVLMLHVGAVLKRHFADRDISAVRRMLR